MRRTSVLTENSIQSELQKKNVYHQTYVVNGKFENRLYRMLNKAESL